MVKKVMDIRIKVWDMDGEPYVEFYRNDERTEGLTVEEILKLKQLSNGMVVIEKE